MQQHRLLIILVACSVLLRDARLLLPLLLQQQLLQQCWVQLPLRSCRPREWPGWQVGDVQQLLLLLLLLPGLLCHCSSKLSHLRLHARLLQLCACWQQPRLQRCCSAWQTLQQPLALQHGQCL